MQLYELIVNSAFVASKIQKNDGSMTKGHNGPWNDSDTPVRTTAHWAICFYKAFKISGDTILKEAAFAACDYLLSDKARPYGLAFYCREGNIGKNKSNGLIGQAWGVEPLIYIGIEEDNKTYISVAQKILDLHPYCKERHGWSIIEISGEIDQFCHTLNQQLWFAAMANKVANPRSNLFTNTTDFLTNLPDNLQLIRSNLIHHKYQLGGDSSNRELFYLHKLIAQTRKFTDNRTSIKTLIELSEGYQSFVLYAFAMIFEDSIQTKQFFEKGLIHWLMKAANFTYQSFVPIEFSKNKFAWTYNPVGFELAYFWQTVGAIMTKTDVDSISPEFLVNLQINNFYDFENQLLQLNTTDPTVLASRLYEACRLNNYNIVSN